MTGLANALWRIGLRVAYRVLRVWWWLRRPEAHGAFVAVWRGTEPDELLVVRNSYRAGESVPAGAIHRGEHPVDAAARELREEVGLHTRAEDLVAAGVYVVDFEGKRDHAHFFEWQAPPGARPVADGREVVHTEWLTVVELGHRPLLPHTRAYLEARSQSAS